MMKAVNPCGEKGCKLSPSPSRNASKSKPAKTRQFYTRRELLGFCQHSTARTRRRSAAHKNRILADLATDIPCHQPRLDLQQPPIADPIVKQGMSHKLVHPQFIRSNQ